MIGGYPCLLQYEALRDGHRKSLLYGLQDDAITRMEPGPSRHYWLVTIFAVIDHIVILHSAEAFTFHARAYELPIRVPPH